MIIRPYAESDTAQLLELMKALARFEDYIEDFAATEADLIKNGLGEDPLFKAFVAEDTGTPIGMAVTYIIPWTYTLKPKLVLKELFVTEAGRGKGVGAKLMEAVLTEARKRGAGEVIWTVMAGNQRAESFYRKLGGQPDDKWNNWHIRLNGG